MISDFFSSLIPFMLTSVLFCVSLRYAISAPEGQIRAQSSSSIPNALYEITPNCSLRVLSAFLKIKLSSLYFLNLGKTLCLTTGIFSASSEAFPLQIISEGAILVRLSAISPIQSFASHFFTKKSPVVISHHAYPAAFSAT